MRKTKTFLTLSCASLFIFFSLVDTVVAAADDLQPSITVTGMGEVFAKPDMARVNIGVVTPE